MSNSDSCLKQLFQWRIGLGVILSILTLRLLGLSDSFELLAFDQFLAVLKFSRPESVSSPITLVSLDQDFLDGWSQGRENSVRKGIIPEAPLRELLQTLLQHEPAVVGLDIVSDRISPTDEQQLAQIINQNSTIVTVEKVLDPKVSPLANLSPYARQKQVAANDFPADRDGTVRRAVLNVEKQTEQGEEREFIESLSLRLASIYLESHKNIEVGNGVRDIETVRFGTLEVPRLRSNSGAYVREDTIYGLQTLLNFRRCETARQDRLDSSQALLASKRCTAVFSTLTADQVLKGTIDPALVRDRILIIGITAPSLASYSSTPIEISQFSNVPSQAVGIELQANATSQIVAAVLEGRPLLRTFPPLVEYLLICSAGCLGIGIGRFSASTAKNLLSLGGILMLLLLLSLITMFFWGWWLPIAPSVLVLSINGVAYIAYYQNERTWKQLTSQLNLVIRDRDRVIRERDQALCERNEAIDELKSERLAAIEAATHEIHNGPLQTLAVLIRRSQSPQIEAAEFQADLKQLNQEIRCLSNNLTQAAMADGTSLGLGNGERLDASLPLHELLYSVFDATLSRDFPGLKTLRLTLRDFEPCPQALTPELKRDIGYFLEEALCNVGKHAISTTQLRVLGQVVAQKYCLSVRDNGALAANYPLILHRGTGTQKAENLASQLRGEFNRHSCSPHGLICELSWPIQSD